MSAVGQRSTRPGEALCNEHIGRFVRLIEENPKEALTEYRSEERRVGEECR